MTTDDNLPLWGGFGGETYNKERDEARLKAQVIRVKRLMSDGRWRTLGQIEADTGDPQASVSARLRDLRKPKFGGHLVERRYDGHGLWAYRLTLRSH